MKLEGRPGIEELFLLQQTGKTEALHKILTDFLIAYADPDSSNYNTPLWRSDCDKTVCKDELLEQPTFQPNLTTRLTHEATRFIENKGRALPPLPALYDAPSPSFYR